MKKKSKRSKNMLKNPTELLEISKSQSKSSSKEKIHLWNALSAVDFVCEKLNIKLDPWQKEYIEAEGDTAVRAGRQSGKSFAQSIKTAIFAMKYPKSDGIKTILITGGVERQAYELYLKVRSVIEQIAPHMIKGKPTMEKTELYNNVRILSLPCGRDGAGLRNYALIRLVVDEAHFVHDDVYIAIEPMLATTNGTMDLLSTPKGNKGKFYEAFQEGSGFKTFHTTSEECPRITKEFLAKQKKSMSKLQYTQEYLAEFINDLQQFYPDEIVDPCVKEFPHDKRGLKFLGVDVARYGGDENAFVISERIGDNIKIIHIETTEKVSAWETIKRIKALEHIHKFKKIYIDDGGVGGPILDVLLNTIGIRHKILGLNNASRSVVYDKTRGKRILKEDLHGNLRRLMEQKVIYLPKNDKMLMSLWGIQFEYTEHENLKIFGKKGSGGDHIAEAMTRAVWPMIEKHLNIRPHTF